MDGLKDLKDEVKELRDAIMKLSQNVAVNNHILAEHHKRSMTLEEALKPVQAHVALVNAIAKIGIGSGGLVALVASAIKIWESAR
jgi:Mg2+ and Co2+ transporter CorA